MGALYINSYKSVNDPRNFPTLEEVRAEPITPHDPKDIAARGSKWAVPAASTSSNRIGSPRILMPVGKGDLALNWGKGRSIEKN